MSWKDPRLLNINKKWGQIFPCNPPLLIRCLLALPLDKSSIYKYATERDPPSLLSIPYHIIIEQECGMERPQDFFLRL